VRRLIEDGAIVNELPLLRGGTLSPAGGARKAEQSARATAQIAVASRTADFERPRAEAILPATAASIGGAKSMKALVCAALGALLAAISTPSYAAALDSARTLRGHASPAAQQVADKRCTNKQGGRHCRNPSPRRAPATNQNGYGYAYGAPKAEFYPAGSSAWWQAMEREGRTGISPD
jgi:hypothetical protein